MKRSFSREYWFLLGSWATFILLGMVCGLISDAVWKGEPAFLDRFSDPSGAVSVIGVFFQEMSRVCPVLAGAVVGVTAIRYWVKPCAVLFLLHWLRIAGLSLPSAAGLGPLAVIGTVLIPALSLVALFGIAKGLYLLFRGREWAVALSLVLLDFLVGVLGLLLASIPAGSGWRWDEQLLGLVKDAILTGVAYGLLYLCIHRWWNRSKSSAAGKSKEMESRQQPE